MFAVAVTFRIRPGQMPAFLPLMHTNAAASRTESGCRQFDVCTDTQRPDEVFLYELYTDAAAFDAHLAAAHFTAFDAATKALVIDRDLRTFATVQS